MRIAHVVNVVDDRGSYGGPLRVALNQVDELRRRGHDVTLLAGARGYPSRSRPSSFAGTRITLARGWGVIPGAGFAGSFAPGVTAHLARRARGADDRRYDVVHVHLGRDLTTLPAATALQLLGVPYVVQTHGMIDASRRALSRPLDALMTRRALAGAHEVLVLTDRDERDVAGILAGRPWRSRRLPNGVALPEVVREPGTEEQPRPQVLYFGRLHERKRPLAFVEMAARAHQSGVRADFAMVGADEGELPAVRAAMTALSPDVGVRYEGPMPMGDSSSRLRQASVLVLPSDADTFPMVLLEAMAVRVPVVCMQSCGLAADVVSAGAGLVVPDADPDAAAAAVAELLSDPARAAEMGRAGRRLVADRFSIGAVAQELEGTYAAAAAQAGSPAGGGR